MSSRRPNDPVPLGEDPADDTDPEIVAPAQRGLPIPYGLFVVLGLYALSVVGFVYLRYWSSPRWMAARHVEEAMVLLGSDSGRTTPPAELVVAYEHLLEAARLQPRIWALHDELERLNWRFEERNLDQPQELRRRAEAVAVLFQREKLKEENALLLDTRSRGWDRRTLLAGPATAFLWSSIGAVLIIAVWLYLRFVKKEVKEEEKAEHRAGVARDVEELGRFRRRGKKQGVPDER